MLSGTQHHVSNSIFIPTTCSIFTSKMKVTLFSILKSFKGYFLFTIFITKYVATMFVYNFVCNIFCIVQYTPLHLSEYQKFAPPTPHHLYCPSATNLSSLPKIQMIQIIWELDEKMRDFKR